MSDGPTGWVTVKRAAAVIGRSPRALRLGIAQCSRGGTWHGVRLVSRISHGRGGHQGTQFLIGVDELVKAFPQHEADLLATAVAEGELVSAPGGGPAVRGAKPNRRIKRRADRGGERVLFLRRLCGKTGLSETAQAAIAAELDNRVKRLWASAASQAGWRTIARYAAQDLYSLCCEHGADLPEAELRTLCRVPRSYICRWERRRHRKTHIARTDAKAFHDTLPSIRRQRPAWPLEVAVLDVTQSDIYCVRSNDGSQQKIALLFLLDWCTGMLFGHAYARRKGEGVRQEHTAASFLVFAAQVGLPEILYIDRGPEYRWVQQLENAGITTRIQSTPYLARSKVVEPVHRVYNEQFLSQFPSYIGSNRLHKKTEAVGQPPPSFDGSIQEALAMHEQAVALYNATPQGRDGRSPYDRWKAAVDSGFQPQRIDVETMVEVLGQKEPRMVRRGAVRLDGWEYSSDELCRAADLEGERVTVHSPLIKGFPPSVFGPDGRFISLVHPVSSYGPTDPAGAKEAARIKKLRRQGARILEQQAPPADISPYQQQFLDIHPPPEPAPAGETVDFPGERGRAAAARRRMDGTPRPALPAPDQDHDDEAAADAVLDRILGIA